MNKNSPFEDSPLPLSIEEQIDRICMDFEAAWKAGQEPLVEDYLGDAQGPIRSSLLRELLLLDWDYRKRAGENLAISEFHARFPHDRELIDTSLTVESTATAGFERGDEDEEVRRKIRQLENFEILEELAPGVGGMGLIFMARDLDLDRVVAIKVPKSPMKSAQGRAFFVREARSAARLDHPNIVKIYNFHSEHDPPYYVMQYVAGEPLDKACQGMDSKSIASILEKTAATLSYAHSRSVIHRDIKPGNILVDSQTRQPYITDFGLAENWEEIESVADGAIPTPQLAGTAGFIAPEVYEGTGTIDPRVDVFALGVTMYKLLTGRHPFPGSNFQEVKANVLKGECPFPKDINPDVPEPLQRICLKAMEYNPSDRYESAELMASDIRRFLDRCAVLAKPNALRP